MKKTLVSSALALSLLSSVASADFYVGFDVGTVNNTDELESTTGATASQDNTYRDLSIKIGAGEDGGWKGQLKLSRISYDKTIFDASNKDLTEFGFDIIKEFEVYKNTYPFIKAGLGYGTMDVVGYDESSIKEVSFNVGAGLSYKVVDHVYVLGGVDYVGRSWQDITYGSTTASVTGSGAKLYAGMNFSF